jgi:hypothetical protein
MPGVLMMAKPAPEITFFHFGSFDLSVAMAQPRAFPSARHALSPFPGVALKPTYRPGSAG